MDFEENRPAQDVPLEENIEQTQDERTAQETQQNEAARREKQYETFTMLHDLVYILAGITLVFVFFFRLVGVDGSSMYPTLVDRDYLVLESNFLYRSVRAGDIVVIDPPEEAGFSGPIVKRVIATGARQWTLTSTRALCTLTAKRSRRAMSLSRPTGASER